VVATDWAYVAAPPSPLASGRRCYFDTDNGASHEHPRRRGTDRAAPKSNRGRARSPRILPHGARRLPVLHLGSVAIMVLGGMTVLPAASA
jgi:hypothetical protein